MSIFWIAKKGRACLINIVPQAPQMISRLPSQIMAGEVVGARITLLSDFASEIILAFMIGIETYPPILTWLMRPVRFKFVAIEDSELQSLH